MAAAHGVTRPLVPTTLFTDAESVDPEISNRHVLVAAEMPTSSHVTYMTIAVPVRNRGSSSAKAKSCKKHRLNTATAPATAVVKQEDALVVTGAAEPLHEPSEGLLAQEKLLQATRKVLCVFTENLINLHKTHVI